MSAGQLQPGDESPIAPPSLRYLEAVRDIAAIAEKTTDSDLAAVLRHCLQMAVALSVYAEPGDAPPPPHRRTYDGGPS